MITDPRDDAKLRAAFESLSDEAEFTPDCPAPERLWAGARGELPPSEVESLVMHVAECGACAEAWRVAKDFGESAAYATPVHVFRWWMPAAAVVVLAAGVSLIYFTRPAAPVAPVAPVARVARVAPVAPAFAITFDKPPVRVSPAHALTFRGANAGTFLAELKAALDPYERGDYAAAAQSLTALRAKYRDVAEPALYEGLSLLLSGDAANAIEPLEHARDLVDVGQLEDVTWYLAAAYERAGRTADAQRFAQAVCNLKARRSEAACQAAANLTPPR